MRTNKAELVLHFPVLRFQSIESVYATSY